MALSPPRLYSGRLASLLWHIKFSRRRRATKRFLRYYDKEEVASSVHAVFVGDYVSNKIITDGVFEKRELQLLAKDIFPSLSRDSTVLDVGANIGNHAVFFADYFARVIAFEPNPMVSKLLHSNAIGREIEVVETGLSDTSGSVDFKINRRNLGGSRISQYEGDTKIQVTRLDSLVDRLELSSVSLIKIDVEGHEDRMIAGASGLLSTLHPVLAMEGHYGSDCKKGERVTSQLTELGYRYFYALTDDLQEVGKLKGKLRRAFVPYSMRKSSPMRLERIQTLTGRDHNMAIIANRPLESGLSPERHDLSEKNGTDRV